MLHHQQHDDDQTETDFDFWVSQDQYRDEEFDQCKQDTRVFGDNSLSLWKTKPRNSAEYEFSPLLSPQTRSEAIEKGRKELMEMVRNIPESSYELSMKDLVDEAKTTSTPEPTKKTKFVSRTPSIDKNKVYLININTLFPWFSSSKKKSTSSRVSPRTSSGRKLWMEDEQSR